MYACSSTLLVTAQFNPDQQGQAGSEEGTNFPWKGKPTAPHWCWGEEKRFRFFPQTILHFVQLVQERLKHPVDTILHIV